MKNITELRKKIDELDDDIIKLLNERFLISKEIGAFKASFNLLTTNSSRENEILEKSNKFTNCESIKNVYLTIFTESKKLQKKYFLVGKRLDYSLSKLIHEKFNNKSYDLVEINDFSELYKFDFLGINVTNPYKHDAYLIADELGETAQKTQIVNTLIRKNEHLYGFNTDYDGFLSLLKHYNIDYENKTIGIIGNGATSKTIKAVFQDEGCQKVYNFVRTVRNESEISLLKITSYSIDILVNTSNYNVYPNFEVVPLVNLSKINNLKLLIDVNYNPFRSVTSLKYKNIKYINGLWMLIEQAKKTEEIFHEYLGLENDCSINSLQIYNELTFLIRNIVLIGMPFAGKTTIGKILKNELNYELYDTDEILYKNQNDLSSSFEKALSESDFRKKESELISLLSKKNHSIIATGGGSILNDDNIFKLSQNGIIIFLNPPLDTLIKRIDNSRPLTSNINDLTTKYNERLKKYQEAADYVIDTTDTELIIKQIKEIIKNENIDN